MLASDASEWEYGVTSMSTKSSEAAKVGRVAERSRFRHNGNLGARVSAFQAAGDLGRWANAVGVDRQSLQDALPEGNEMWEPNDRFPEVPGDWRAKPLWTVLRGSPWRKEENMQDRCVPHCRLVVVTLVQKVYDCCVLWVTWRYVSQLDAAYL